MVKAFTRLWSLRFHMFGMPSHTLYLRRPAFGYRLVVRARSGKDEKTITQLFANLSSALLLARRYDRPVELWFADDHLCTIGRIAGNGPMWVIAPGQPQARQRTSSPEVSPGTRIIHT